MIINMTKAIEISGSDSTFLNVSLHDILQLLPAGALIHWKLLWLEATWHEEGESILELEAKVNNSTDGYMLSWNELLKLSKCFDQIIDIVLIGDRELSRLRRFDTDEEMHTSCCYCLQLIDSTYWLIHSCDEEFIKKLSKTISGVKSI